jgi:hypothetical protein
MVSFNLEPFPLNLYPMTISNEPLVPGSPVQFKAIGFPDEDAVKSSIQRFYVAAPHADKKFLVNNIFGELIISGHINDEGKIEEYTSHPRPEKNFLKQ